MADEVKTGLEELAKESVSGAGTEGKVAESQQGTASATGEQASKRSWVTSLPQDLRDGVDESKYGSMGDYIRDLKARADRSDRDEKAFTDGWDSFSEEMRNKNLADALPESVTAVLKDSGVDAGTARKIYDALFQFGTEQMEKQKADSEAEMREFIRTKWGAEFQKNNEAVKRGLRYFGKDHPELMLKAEQRKSIYTPEFAQLLADYSRLRDRMQGESIAPEGNPAKKENDDNPYGLKNM